MNTLNRIPEITKQSLKLLNYAFEMRIYTQDTLDKDKSSVGKFCGNFGVHVCKNARHELFSVRHC